MNTKVSEHPTKTVLTGKVPEFPDYMKSASMAESYQADSEALQAAAAAIVSVPRLAWEVVNLFCAKYDLLLVEPEDETHQEHLASQK